MPLATYDEVHKDKIEYAIQERFAPEIRQLRSLGFDEEFYVREIGFPMSFLVFFPFVAYEYLRGGIFRVSPLLRVIFYQPYLLHEEGYAYAVASKFSGVKYATMFDDGTLLHSRTQGADQHKSDPQKRYVFQCLSPKNVELTWQRHTETVQAIADEGL